jgi:hypothetical protein
MMTNVKRAVDRVLAMIREGGDLPPSPRDPYAWKPVPRRPLPNLRTSSVAVAEPDDD